MDFIEIDVTNVNSIRLARQELENKILQLDVLINNVGIAGEQLRTLSAGSIESFRKVFETNFFGAVMSSYS